MADDNIIEELEQGGEKKDKKGAPKAKKLQAKAEINSKRETDKESSFLFPLVVVAVVILAIIGVVFGYTKDKLTQINKGGTDVTKDLENQVGILKQKLDEMQKKAENLEKTNEVNKEVVIDLFDKSRVIPLKVNAANWNLLDNKDLSFMVSYPKSWEAINPIVDTKEKTQPKTETISLQPVGKAEFVNAITIRSDYADFAKLKMSEKEEIFKELDVIDRADFPFGKMIYFINFDKENNEVPTILVLTADNIYRATFNIADKKADNYFEYRKTFEDVVATFALRPLVAQDKTATAPVKAP
jgi:hypothetical protein